ncbi:hypothetical protein PC118_g17983 [Phytophthora cactorum]|uniref:Rad50/SbcC-type AAA domain-containing protein n=1 Tax=Phytophthora cactorum TaxID=29920 RepID=A0A8T1FBG2_9STRA|nr:hypothetical protein PC117_g19548 [Phytophthora cactorum]KAG2968490.1 hypothetical protein PC118_g17983 [Phytophthora cactorum]KAG3065595.1 hypothetical protein PC122_g18071 [Phytophthora cactorum]
MYHRKLRVSLSPHINFIAGENGSCKSAIIAAIQICFGASARTTHRGKNIKAFIRHGFDGNALVRVKLRNDDGAGGSDAFHPGKYGKQIIVERLIRRDGSAEYRLKNEQGLLVSKLKSDLDAMMDHLNIQTDNPCAVLEHENAKLFLKGTSQDKYKFFLQSTDLAKMRTTYTRIDETTRMIAESTLTQEKAKIVTLRDAKNKVKKHWQEAQSIEKLEDELNTLKQKERDVVNNAEKLAETKEVVEELEKDQNEANAKLEETSTRMSENHRQKMDAQSNIREARRPLQRYKAELKRLTRSKERTKQQLTRVQYDLQQKRDRHAALLQSLTEGSKDLQIELTNALKELEDRHDGCKDKKTLRLSQAAKAKPSCSFRPTTDTNKPVSVHISAHWTTGNVCHAAGSVHAAIEVATGTALRNYLVVNGQDKALVDKLRRQAHCTSTEANMIITVRTGYRYHNLELPDGGLAGQAICSILQVSNDEVFNALIDTCALESKLLFDDREVAESRVLTGPSGGFRVANSVSEVYLPTGDKFVVRRGNLAYIANKRDRRGYIISQNVDRGIAELENKLNCLEKKVDELRRDETVLSHDKEELGNAIKQRNDRINDLSRRYNQHRVQLRCLDEEMADALQDHTLDTSVLEGECRSTEDELEDFQRREQALNDTIASDRSLQDRLDALEKVETVEKMITAEISERQSDADAVYKRLREAKVDEITGQRELEAAQAAVEKLEQHLVTVRGDCDEQTQIALKLGGKPAEVNPPAHCNKRIQTVERPLARVQNNVYGLSLSELKTQMEVQEAKYRQNSQL